ncbi:hypothetical protein D9758_005020 [Tetrapyrgos nigripes]|uniref:Gag protein n=1 Tax=Tetrapyrgos nigripes TaxID=182062 RepID=A0A8H5LWM0_9AGAR|nr:hypothetical protein D9758_005020 [Tetrapyrgos nigripes]
MHSRRGSPAPRADNPKQTTRSQSGSRNQSRRGSPRPQEYVPPAPDLHCAYQAHVYDFDDYIDCFWDIESEEFYQCNKTAHPCPNRYNSIPLPPKANPNPWGRHINRGQEPLINGHRERTAPPPRNPLVFPPPGQPREAAPQPSTSLDPQSSSSSVPEAPEQAPKRDPTPPPLNPPSQDPEPHPNPPSSPSPPSNPDDTIDSDSDDDMSKATKAFDKVTKLEKDRSNWSTWVTRVQRAAGSIGYDKCYKNKPTSKELWDALKQDYDAKDPLTEASLEKQLFSLTCTNPAKVGKHLDNLITIMDELVNCGVTIPDSQFKSAIISSTPNMYQATIKALITVYREEPSKLTPEMLIAAIRAEAQGKNFASSSNKSQESVEGVANLGEEEEEAEEIAEEAEEDHHSEVKEISEAEAEVEQEEIGKAATQQRRNPAVTTVEDLRANITREHRDDRNYREDKKNGENGQRNGKGRDTASSAIEKNKEDSDEGSWMAIGILEIEDSIDHPTIDCSNIAEEAAFVALEHTPPILFNSRCSSHIAWALPNH